MLFDDDRALITAKELERARQRKHGIFANGIRCPEDELPQNIERGSREHELYLFYFAPLTPKAKSDVIAKGLREMFTVHPELFDPARVREMSRDEFRALAKPYMPHGDKDIEIWYTNSIELKKFSDNPVNIWNRNKDVRFATKQLQKFSGYGPKITPMLVGWYHKYGLNEFDNVYELRIPVDVHVITLSVGRRILTLEQPIRNEVVTEFLRENYYQFFKNHVGLNSWEYQESLWNVGAYACNSWPCRKVCPLEEPCRLTIDKKRYGDEAIIEVRPFGYQEVLL